jgi:hypothetical protein
VKRLLPLLSLLALAGCEGDFVVPDVNDGTRPPPPRCADLGGRLAVTPETATVGAGALFRFSATGGAGVYRYRLVENPSGGDVDPRNGVYVAGLDRGDETTPPTDILVVSDEGCEGEATAVITVADAPVVAPSRVEIEPGGRIQFEEVGGSGMATFQRGSTWTSGGTLTPEGAYVAGGTLGRDVVELTDTGLDGATTAMAIVEVVEDASLAPTVETLVIPVGSRALRPVGGGSSLYDVGGAGALVGAEDDGTLTGLAPGRAELTYTDRYTGETASLAVRVTAPLEAPRRHPGDRSEAHYALGAGDLNGDGHPEALAALPFASGDHFRSGLVLLYRSDGEGLEPEPVQVFSGAERDAEFGRQVAVADLDQDGRVDLLIGVARADATSRDIGEVQVHRGLEDGSFEAEASRTFVGAGGFTRFGTSLAVCDFNGDGVPDVAAGAPFQEDSDPAADDSLDPPAVRYNDQGAIQVFLGYGDGQFVSTPDQTIYGRAPRPTDGQLFGVPSMRLGYRLRAADIDGDGRCDLAAFARTPARDRGDAGMVAIYRGVPAAEDTRGGLSEPVALFIGDRERSGQLFGEELILADVTGDDRPDLIVSDDRHDPVDPEDPRSVLPDGGAVWIFDLRDLGTEPASGYRGIEEAAWSAEGGPFDRLGQGLAVGDFDGDGIDDVISGDSRAQRPVGEGEDPPTIRPGLVRVYTGFDDGVPTTNPFLVEGPERDARFGLGLGVIGDADDRAGDDLLVFAPYLDGDEPSDDAGGLFFVGGDLVPRRLELRQTPAGSSHGQGVAWIGDLNGDGFPELAASAPFADVTGVGVNVGSVAIYRGTRDGVARAPAQVLQDFDRHSEFDEFGEAVAGVGDFDGDGIGDLAVVAQSEDRSTSYPAETYTVLDGPCASGNNNGALFLFRGRTDGTVEAEPFLIVYGPVNGRRLEAVAGGLDFDGDGRNDVVLGGRDWNQPGFAAGGVAVVFGRDTTPGTIEVQCVPDWFDRGAPGSRLGQSLAAAGDLDLDGCDDFIAGTPEADPNLLRNAGGARVYFGFGPTCGRTEASFATFEGANRDAQAGLSVGGGVDLDMDLRPDLVVGAGRYRDSEGEVGRSTFVSGDYAVRLVDGRGTGPLVDGLSSLQLSTEGLSPGARAGWAVGMVTDGALVGAPFDAANGIGNSGGAAVHRFDPSRGLELTPRLRVVGEAFGGGQLGASVASWSRGGRTWVALGAPRSSAAEGAVDDGAVYVFVE